MSTRYSDFATDTKEFMSMDKGSHLLTYESASVRQELSTETRSDLFPLANGSLYS